MDKLDEEEPENQIKFSSDFAESDAEDDIADYSYLKAHSMRKESKHFIPLHPGLLSIKDLQTLTLRQAELENYTMNDLQNLAKEEWLQNHQELINCEGLSMKFKLRFITHVPSMQTFDNLLSLIRLAIKTNYTDPVLELQTLCLAFLGTKVENRTLARDQIREALTQVDLGQLSAENILLASKLDVEFCKKLLAQLNYSKPKQKKILLRVLKSLSEVKLLSSVVDKTLAQTVLLDSGVNDPLVILGLFQVYRGGSSFEVIKTSLQSLETLMQDWETRYLKITSFDFQSIVGFLDIPDKLTLYVMFDRILLSKKFTKLQRSNLIGLLGSMLTSGRIDCYFFTLRMKSKFMTDPSERIHR